MNKNLLLGKMVAAGFTQRETAIHLGISENTFSKRINGRGQFNLEDVNKMCELFNITDDSEKCHIFLQ